MGQDELTQRQRELLSELPASKEELAATFSVKGSTVEGHFQNIRNVVDDREAVVWNRRAGQYEIHMESLRGVSEPLRTEDDDAPEGDVEPGETSPASDGEKDPQSIEIPNGVVDQLRSGGVTYDDLEEEYGIKKDSGRRLLQKLRENGHRIDFKETNKEGKRLFFIPQEEDKRYKAGDGDGVYRIAIISDTHLGSQAEHLDELHDFYDRAQNRNVDFVLHAGDISDGWKIYRGHINEIRGEAAGWDRLTEYVLRNYPERKGLDTLFITGNHDHKLHRRSGIYFGERIDNRRDDLHWLGDSQASVVLDAENNIDIELIHPSGGQPYTVGYRLQTLYRERGLDNRPTIAVVGHLHGSIYAKTEGVFGLYAGCWKGTTTYGKRKGHESTIGGWIVEIEIVNGEVRRLRPEWINYGSRDETQNFSLEDIQDMIS